MDERDYKAMNEELNQPSCLCAVSGGAFWNDDKVIEFINWYVKLHKLDFRYTLENRTLIESFKNGDDASKWHFH